jgi:exopolyphosphatase/guanosine-5'-triphosphate,3'-diphosphate pyrophosphatase
VKGQHPEIIDREKEMVRLGAGSLREHLLSREKIERAVTTLRRYKQMAEANRADLIIATATSAVREAHNAVAFIDTVRREVGLDVLLLPGFEEARLIALAVSAVTDFNNRRALIIDIGGGSTEFVITGGVEPELLYSVRIGAVRLAEKFISTDPISESEHERLVTGIRSDLTHAVWEIKNRGYDFVVGTSGTILNMVRAAVLAEHPNRGEALADIEPFGETVTLDQITRLNRRLARMDERQRGRVPGLEKDRADIIIAGGLLLECIMTEVGAREITSCDWSLREGVILNYLRSHQIPNSTETANSTIELLRSNESKRLDVDGDDSSLDVRARSVLSVARRYDYDAPHSHHVASLAARIFDDTHELHGMGETERRLLEYAALLHDIGYHIAHNNHHRHGLYLIKNAEMPGFTANEIALMATAVRYHRGSLPKKGMDSRSRREHEDYLALERSQRSKLLKLASILQIADGLDRSHGQLVAGVRCEMSGARVTFYVESPGDCDLEMWSAERKASWFSEVFQISTRFERAPAKAVTSQAEAATDQALGGRR